MTSETSRRRLAAILHADVADYSRLTGTDEVGTHRALIERLDLLADAVGHHGGKVGHFAGDAVLAEFPSALQALTCAIGVQRAIDALNAGISEERQLRFRIGINLGDVISDRGEIYGDGVNIAARLEALAEPGGICVSGSVHDTLGASLPLEFEDLGEQTIKHIAQPIRVYRVRADPAADLPGPVVTPRRSVPPRTVRCPQCANRVGVAAIRCEACGAPLRGDADPFVGRETELAALEAALDQATAGRGQVMLLAGEAGIGKTRIAQEFAARAVRREVQVLWGRCNEEPGAPLYWPWVQLLRGWLKSSDPELRAEVEDAAAIAAELVPELSSGSGKGSAPPPAMDPAQARFRLFDAVSRLWQQAATQQPLVLILDDLHWADTASLKLLAFLGREFVDAALLVIASYRDQELTRQHPLSDTVGELSRLPHCRRLPLWGITPHEAQDFLALLAGGDTSSSLAAALHAHSDGNPLFLRELIRDAMSAGPLAAEPLRVPAGVREVIGQRLNRLSTECNRLLSMAAVVGRRFDLELLAGLESDLDEPAMSDALDEALAARVVQELPQERDYQFSHALVRETLYDELPAARRRRLHEGIGKHLEARHAQDLDPHLSQLAYHFGCGSSREAAQRALDFAQRAGARADRLLAYEEAVHFYAKALQAYDRSMALDEPRRCGLLLAMAQAQNRAGAGEAALQTFQQTAVLARRLGQAETLAQAALGFENASWRIGGSGEPSAILLEEALEGQGAQDEALRADLLAALCRANIYRVRLDEVTRVHALAVRLARRLGDPRTLVNALSAITPGRFWPEQLEQRVAAAHEALALAEAAGRPDWTVGQLTGWYVGDLMELGDTEAARAVTELHLQVSQRMRQPFLQAVGLNAHTMLTLHEGRFADAEREARKTLELGRRISLAPAEGVFGVQMFTISRELGRLAELLPVLRHFVETTPRLATWRPGLAVVYADLEMRQEAQEAFNTMVAEGLDNIPLDAVWSTSITYLAEVCAYLNDMAQAGVLYRLLLPYAGHNVVCGAHTVCYGSADRFLGILATTCGRWDEAERHFEAAIAMDQRTCGRPWLAHSRYQYARLQQAQSRSGPATESVTAALVTARELGMAKLEHQCLAFKDALGARPDNPAGLSKREVEVLRLISVGSSNREIAEQLCLSPNTVASHVRSILTKTNTANRTEAATYAARHGLTGNPS